MIKPLFCMPFEMVWELIGIKLQEVIVCLMKKGETSGLKAEREIILI